MPVGSPEPSAFEVWAQGQLSPGCHLQRGRTELKDPERINFLQASEHDSDQAKPYAQPEAQDPAPQPLPFPSAELSCADTPTLPHTLFPGHVEGSGRQITHGPLRSPGGPAHCSPSGVAPVTDSAAAGSEHGTPTASWRGPCRGLGKGLGGW